MAGGYQLLTLPEFGEHLQRLHQREIDTKLTKAALETLASIAYKQPILRADIEAIRGVACGETIRSLMEKRLVNIAGRAEEPGRPILYGTTKRFLEVFGLNTLKDLPQSEDGFEPPNEPPIESTSASEFPIANCLLEYRSTVASSSNRKWEIGNRKSIPACGHAIPHDISRL